MWGWGSGLGLVAPLTPLESSVYGLRCGVLDSWFHGVGHTQWTTNLSPHPESMCKMTKFVHQKVLTSSTG